MRTHTQPSPAAAPITLQQLSDALPGGAFDAATLLCDRHNSFANLIERMQAQGLTVSPPVRATSVRPIPGRIAWQITVQLRTAEADFVFYIPEDVS
jgi:hypothetical protein